LTDSLVALKEIRLEYEEGAPCTAIREGNYPNLHRCCSKSYVRHCFVDILIIYHFVYNNEVTNNRNTAIR